MKKLKLVFMGTPEFSVPVLEALAKSHDILAVYTQPDKPVGRGLELKASPVKMKATELGIAVFQPIKLTLPGEYEKLQLLAPDAIVVVAYGQILKKNILDLPRLGCINIHSSLLPRWRGAAPIHHAILSGDRITGVTTMQMVEKLDAGDIYLKKEISIGARETVSELHDRLSQLGAELIGPTLEGLEQGSLQAIAQNENEVTYATKLTKEMEKLDTTLSARELDRQIRALNPWPGTSLMLEINGKTERIKIRQARAQIPIQFIPGYIGEQAGMLVLGTAQGVLEILKIQPEGKKEMDAGSFLNGLRGRGVSLPIRVSSG